MKVQLESANNIIQTVPIIKIKRNPSRVELSWAKRYHAVKKRHYIGLAMQRFLQKHSTE